MAGLIETLTQEAEARRDKILADARAESEKIFQGAEEEIEDIRKKRFKECDDKLQLERGRILGDLQLQSRNLLMQAKYEVLEQAFRSARAKLADLRGRREYVDVFNSLAGEALEAFEGDYKGGLIVFADERDVELCRDFFDSRKIPYEMNTSMTFLGGVQISTANGEFRVSNLVEGRLAKKRDELLGRLANILFEN